MKMKGQIDFISMLVETLLDCLQLFFSDKIFKLIVEQSSCYLEQQSNNGADDRWTDIIIAEMKAFMGILWDLWNCLNSMIIGLIMPCTPYHGSLR